MSSNRWSRTARAKGLAVLVAAGLLLWLDGCASSGAVRLEAMRTLGAERVWPPPPDAPRVRLVTTFSSPDDLGFRRSFFGRLVDFIRGESRHQQIKHPYGVVATEDDVIYVVDSAAKGVHAYDLTRSDYRFLTGNGFANPVGIALGSGKLYVTDSEASAVVILDTDGEELGRITNRLMRPTGVAVSPTTNNVFVVDTEAHSVLVFDPEGAHVSTFGRRGVGPGEFNYPTLIAVGPDGRLFVSDALNFRVPVLAQDGTPIQSLGRLGDAVGEFARPKGLGVDSEGRVFVVEGLYDVVNLFDPEGQLLMTFGNAGRSEGSFWLATGLAVDGQGRIFVSDSYNGRVQVFEMLERSVQ